MCNRVARAIKIFSGTGSLEASHGCCALTVLKNNNFMRLYSSSSERHALRRLCILPPFCFLVGSMNNFFWHMVFLAGFCLCTSLWVRLIKIDTAFKMSSAVYYKFQKSQEEI